MKQKRIPAFPQVPFPSQSWARHKRDGDILSPISQSCAPAHGSADIASGMLFGFNPEAKGRGEKREGELCITRINNSHYSRFPDSPEGAGMLTPQVA